MKIYRYWVKAPADGEPDDSNLACFGFSNDSIDEALAAAKARANKLATAVRSGEPPFPYAYQERPVREEIIEEFSHDGQPSAVITRNVYGSLVLNTANVLFADIDYKPEGCAGGLIKLFGVKVPSQDDQVVERVKELVTDDPNLGVRLYRTSKGFRALITTRTYDPLSEEANSLLKRFESDSLYINLCRVQESFRARISPKPWRCGVERPPTLFPFADDATEQRYRDWQASYEAKAASYSTCALIGDFGSSSVHPDVDAIIKLHDHFACEGDGPLA